MKITLIGFMGSGKSTIAKKLSEKLNLKLIEMDKMIEKKAGKTIKGIFAQEGEIAFRQMEIDFAKEYKNADNVVISAGGGVVMNKIILDYFKENNGKVIFLNTCFDEIVKRIGHDSSRPLFQDIQKAKELFDFRQNLYKNYADITIETDQKEIFQLIKEISMKIN